MKNQKQLEGKTIVIVGAAGRIGRVIVDAVLASGARAVALDSDTVALSKLVEKYAEDVLCCKTVDITKRSAIDRALADAHDRFGGLDGAVNAAYPRNARYGRHFFDVEYTDFCENSGLHMGAYFLFMQSCARYSIELDRNFSLVNLSSIYGSMAPRFEIYKGTSMTMSVEYAAIKAGLEHMTRFVNAYMKDRNSAFRANCISPGGILDGQDDLFLESYRSHCMSKGMLDSADVAGAIVFLLSEQARFVAGQTLVVDDGFSI
jgi:NAD(P)-dependent dehydrogenase (short-subunit alcohol dehydrogenase family)